MALGEWLGAVLAFLGPAGLLVAIYILFLLDAAIFPALPELFIVAVYFELVYHWAWTPFTACVALLILGLAGDVSGNVGLYAIFRALDRRGKVPKRMARAMQKWTKFLLLQDERMILLNRLAPAIPLTGAFIAVCGWNLRKSVQYVLLGGAIKYALLLGLAAAMGVAFSPDLSRLVTVVLVLALIAASVVAGRYRTKRMEAAA